MSDNGYSTSRSLSNSSADSAIVQDLFATSSKGTKDGKTALAQQKQLLLYNAGQEFVLVDNAPIPVAEEDNEVLLELRAIGLNPIDWKGPAYGFGLPALPAVLGRDLVGVVIKRPSQASRIRSGDIVLAISTDYRDYRKAAFQQFAIASDYNVCRVPPHIPQEIASGIGVAFVTATLILGVCLGVAFDADASNGGVNLLDSVRAAERHALPEDIRSECYDSLQEHERVRPGDWLAIWGASSTVGFFLLQLAKRAGIKVVCIADAIKHGELLVKAGADVLVHRKNPQEAVDITRSVTGNELKYAVDTVGKDTTSLLQDALAMPQNCGLDVRKPTQSHLVGLVGGPKVPREGVVQHKVPIKLFHESPEVGLAIVTWLEELLMEGSIMLPKVDVSKERGLDAVNSALHRLRHGSLSGHRIVVPI